MSGMGVQLDDDACPGAWVLPAKGVLTAHQQSTLVAMAQEEKLAHDLYVAFAARYDAAVFDRVAAAETRRHDPPAVGDADHRSNAVRWFSEARSRFW